MLQRTAFFPAYCMLLPILVCYRFNLSIKKLNWLISLFYDIRHIKNEKVCYFFFNTTPALGNI